MLLDWLSTGISSAAKNHIFCLKICIPNPILKLKTLKLANGLVLYLKSGKFYVKWKVFGGLSLIIINSLSYVF